MSEREHVCTYQCAGNDCEHVVGPSPEPRVGDEAERREARALIWKLDQLPDYYEPGADGGYYHALDPERARPLVIEALRAAERRGMERAAVKELLWAATMVCRWFDETKCRGKHCPCVPIQDRVQAIRALVEAER